MDKGQVFERLIHLSSARGLQVKFVAFQGARGRLLNDRVGIANNLGIDEINFTLAHELAHSYMHYDKGNILENDGAYEEQADRAARMLLDIAQIA